jgi:xylulokinase
MIVSGWKPEIFVLLTVDIGTSTFKSALWDFDGNCLSFAAIPLSITSEGCKCEAECTQWLRAFETCCRRLGDISAVQAVVISGNGPSLVPVTGEPGIGADGLYLAAEPARLWLDRRAVKNQAEVSALMGGFVDAAFFLPKILGIKNDEGELYRRTKFFLGCPEYLAYALSGEARTVFPSDGFDRWFWNDSVIEKLKLDADKFPAFIRPGGTYGTVTQRAASYFGFARDVRVISGGPDFFAAILGAGITKPGQACDRTGSSEGVNLCTKNRINDERLMSYSHPVKPYHNLSGIISTTGKAIEWCRDLLGISEFDQFFSLARKSEHGSGGLIFLPHLAGERAPVCDPSARGLWRGLNLGTGRSELANSVLEGIGFAIRDVITAMEEIGANVEELRVTGGLAGIGSLNQLKADITGKVITEMVYKEAELLGNAVTGACSLGRFGACAEADFAEAACAFVRIEKTYEPDHRKSALYNRLFSEYRESRFLSS